MRRCGAGVGSAIADDQYRQAGAEVLDAADEVWASADLLLKVKEPVAEEYARLRRDQVLFTYLHLAASRECTQALLDAGTTAIAYETVQLPSGGLPLLYPMSEVAGCLAPQVGAYSLMKARGGRGVLMGGIGGVANAKVVIIGAGVSICFVQHFIQGQPTSQSLCFCAHLYKSSTNLLFWRR